MEPTFRADAPGHDVSSSRYLFRMFLRPNIAWGRLQSAGRTSVIAEVSENAFKAMHNLRTDRANTTQTLNGEAAIDSATEKAIRDYRDTENPAMRSVADLSAAVDFADQKTLLPDPIRQMEVLKALQAESWDAMSKPKSSRRPALAKEYAEVASALLQTLNKLSTQLAAAVAHTAPVVGQLPAIKQLAWLVRDTGGQAALLLSNGLAAGRLPPEARQNYTRFIIGAE